MAAPSFGATANLSTEQLVNTNNHHEKESIFSGEFGYWSNQMVQDVGETVGNKAYGNLNLKYQSHTNKREESVYKGFELRTRVNNEEKLMYSVKEAVIEWRKTNSRFALGRTTLNWSQMDKEWGLGQINNRENFDYFEPGEEGLVGAFYDYKFSNGINVGVFGSMVYVPELNPGMDVNKDNGTVECSNPWCTAPSASTEIEGTETPIYYNVNYPEMSDVVFQYSVGANIGKEFVWGDRKDEKIIFDMNLYALKKPENSISISAEVKYENDNKRIFVDVTPQFYYHDIGGLDLNLEFEEINTRIFFSAISINPEAAPEGGKLLYEYTGIKPRKIKEEYLSGGMEYNTGTFKLLGGYIARVSDFDKKNDILVEYPRWNQAVHIGVDKEFTRKFSISLDYKYDMLMQDRLTMFNTKYRFGPSVVANLGVNIIGTNPDEESFWSEYENNDSVYTSLKYTF
jgi:hypothetical protein